MARSAIIIVAAVLSLGILLFGWIPAKIHSFAADAAFFVRSAAQMIGNSEGVYREFARIITENQNLRAELYSLEHLRNENEILKAALEAEDGVRRKYIPARILIGEHSLSANTITIDKGTRDGLEAGMAVVWGTQTFIGRVKEVFEEHALVETLLSSSLKLSTYVGPQSAPALVTGGTDPIFEFIHTDTPLVVGDHVFTASNLGQIPEDLYVGDVLSIQSVESGVFQSGIIGLPYQLHNMYEVFVLK